MLKQLTFSISIVFISWITGMIINAFLVRTAFYSKKLTHLNFVESKKINKLIGIGIIKWMVKNTPFKFFNPNLKMKAKTELAALNHLHKEMTLAEINHLIAFVLVLLFAIIQIFKGFYSLALIMTITNILMNLYPSLLQQQNKRRLDKLKKILYTRNLSDGTTVI